MNEPPTAELRWSAKELVSEAKARTENLTPEQVERELRDSEVLLVDLREVDERRQHGFISGAVHVTRGMLEFRADPTTPYHQPELRPDRRVILHCASGGRSALATVALAEMGYTNVAHLDGGLNAWRASGRPVKPG